MDYLPKDPAILVSSVNMLLRDEEFDTLEARSVSILPTSYTRLPLVRALQKLKALSRRHCAYYTIVTLDEQNQVVKQG